MTRPAATTDRAAALRRAFDEAFARPPAADPPPTDDLLAVRIAGDAWALRLREITALLADRRVTPLPTAAPGLLGLVGHRGGTVPVWSLRVLLGYPAGAASRWLALTDADGAPLGLGFDGYDGYLRVPRAALVPLVESQRAREHVREMCHADGVVRPILSIPSLVEVIKRQSSGGHPKEP